MNKKEFFFKAMLAEEYKRVAWVFSAFSILKEDVDSWKEDPYPYRIVQTPSKFFFVDPDNRDGQGNSQLTVIEDSEPNTPLFGLQEEISVSQTETQLNLGVDRLVTTYGLLLLNYTVIYYPFKTKVTYINKEFRPKTVEKLIVDRFKDNPENDADRNDQDIYVDEYLKYCEGVSFLETLSQVFTHSITEVGLLPAPGRKEFKKELLKKYEGKLHDPVEMAKFEAELKAFDTEYIKKDPSYGKFMSGKVANSRMKAYMTQGGESNSFVQSMTVTPIINALEDGIPLDEEGFTAISNTIRYGSFSRGSETVNGGVTAKALMRAADNWRITEGDCGSQLGIRRFYSEKEISNIVGRYLIVKGQPVLIETIDQAKPYASQNLIVRSPQYCRRLGTQTCEVCAGKALSKFPTGLPIPLMEVSGGILTDSLKLMHNTALVTEEMNLASVIT